MGGPASVLLDQREARHLLADRDHRDADPDDDQRRDVVALGVWVLLYFTIFLGILRPHRTGDRDLIADLARLKRESRRARPRPIFYVGVVAALAFMVLLLVSRYF